MTNIRQGRQNICQTFLHFQENIHASTFSCKLAIKKYKYKLNVVNCHVSRDHQRNVFFKQWTRLAFQQSLLSSDSDRERHVGGEAGEHKVQLNTTENYNLNFMFPSQSFLYGKVSFHSPRKKSELFQKKCL